MSEHANQSVRFAIVTHPRCGSNLLSAALRGHPQIRMYGELFNDEANERIRAFAAGVRNRPSEQIYYQAVRGTSYDGDQCAGTFLLTRIYLDPSTDRPAAIGFKIFHNQARATPLAKTAWDYLERDADVRIIHLVRRNLLQMLLSLQTALTTNIWARQVGEAAPASLPILEFSSDEAETYFHDILEQRRETMTRLLSSPRRKMLTLEYERDLTSDLDCTLKRIQEFLDVPYVRLEPTLCKQSTLPMQQRIRNYEHLKRCFSNTPFGEFFADDASIREASTATFADC